MFNLAIIGHAADKFNLITELLAKQEIYDLIINYNNRYNDNLTIISGGCHLGGIDIWAEEIAKELNLPTCIYRPKVLSWQSKVEKGVELIGYKDRNLLIAKSDIVVCIVVKEYPENYKGLKFDYCYHCQNKVDNPGQHIKSGGCWTARKCRNRKWIII